MTVLILEVKAAAEDSEEKEAEEKGSNQEMAVRIISLMRIPLPLFKD